MPTALGAGFIAQYPRNAVAHRRSSAATPAFAGAGSAARLDEARASGRL
jgi:hypothetical protein